MKIENEQGDNIVGERTNVTAVEMDGVPGGLQPSPESKKEQEQLGTKRMIKNSRLSRLSFRRLRVVVLDVLQTGLAAALLVESALAQTTATAAKAGAGTDGARPYLSSDTDKRAYDKHDLSGLWSPQPQDRGKETHGVHELVDGNPFENLHIFENLLRHQRFLGGPRTLLRRCDGKPTRDCSQASQCRLMQSEFHSVPNARFRSWLANRSLSGGAR